MIQRFAGQAKKFICALLLAGAFLCSSAPTVAQTNTTGTIRVESKEVLVPVLVVDSQRLEEFQHMKRSIFWQHMEGGYVHFLEPLAVPDLSLKDFTVLQDGNQQRIVSVFPEAQSQAPILTDNLSKYREDVGVGGGTWAVPLWESYGSPGAPVDESPSFSGYAIGFMPASSPDGSCHKLQVMVDRLNVLVFSRNEYCEASGKGADPLHGTALGEQVESNLQKKRRNELSLNVAAIPLFADNGTVRVRIVLDYAPRSNPLVASCKHKSEDIGVVGTFLGEDGREILRFSDEATRRNDNSLAARLFWKILPSQWDTCGFYAPIRYETQIDLPPGNYHLQLGFMDERKFGRVEAAVTVPSYPAEQLSISGIVLARRFRSLQLQPPELPAPVSPMPLRETPTQPAKSATDLPENYPPLVTKGIEVTPTANFRFKRKDEFYFYVQVYEPSNPGTPQPSVNLNVRIVNSKTKKVVRQLQPINAAPYQLPDSPVIPIGGGILIANLPKGSYQLQAQATDSTGASTDWQSVAFTIQ